MTASCFIFTFLEVFMKNLMVLIMAIFFAVVLISCGDEKNETGDTGNTGDSGEIISK